MQPQPREPWEDAFDESWDDAYCVDCLRGSWKREHIKSFIRKTILADREKTMAVLREAVKNAKIAKENYEVFEAMQEALGTDAASWSRGFFEKENLALEAIDTYATSLRTSRGE